MTALMYDYGSNSFSWSNFGRFKFDTAAKIYNLDIFLFLVIDNIFWLEIPWI